MFELLFSRLFGSSGRGLQWQIRKGGKVVESSQPNKPEPADTKVAQASAIRLAEKNNSSKIAAISRGFERALARRAETGDD